MHRFQYMMKFRSGVLRLLALISVVVSATALPAQTDTLPVVTTEVNVDLVSRYIWRGMDVSKGPAIQPWLAASWKGFSIGSWGSYNLTGEGCQETDFFVAKTLGFITVSVWDYWTFDDTSDLDFFNFRDESTAHLLEAQILLSGGDKLPFNFLASYMFYGDDPSRSLYFELQYEPNLNFADLMLFAGYQAKGEMYNPKKGFVNVGCTVERSIDITDRLSLPLSLSLVVNPADRKAWLVAGITF
ncbi:MAG: TorF family putative porin [Bacteroidales bacterium]